MNMSLCFRSNIAVSQNAVYLWYSCSSFINSIINFWPVIFIFSYSYPQINIFDYMTFFPFLSFSCKSLYVSLMAIYYVLGTTTHTDLLIFLSHILNPHNLVQFVIVHLQIALNLLSCPVSPVTSLHILCQFTRAVWIYRVIHKSLRNSRNRLRKNQERQGRKEHINR